MFEEGQSRKRVEEGPTTGVVVKEGVRFVAVDIGVEFEFEFESEEDLDCAIVLLPCRLLLLLLSPRLR